MAQREFCKRTGIFENVPYLNIRKLFSESSEPIVFEFRPESFSDFPYKEVLRYFSNSHSYIFENIIRKMLIDWLSISEGDMILIVDEAHNLPDYIRDLFSLQLSMWMINNCVIEAEKYGDPSIIDGKFSLSGLCKLLIEKLSFLIS